MTKVLFVEDHAAIRQPLSFVMNLEPDLDVIEAESLGQARARLEGMDVLLADIQLSDGYGTDLIPEFTKANPLGRTVVLTGSRERADLVRAVEAGAACVLYKLAGTAEIIETVRAAASGKLLLSSKQLKDMLTIAEGSSVGKPQAAGKLDRLTSREMEILQRMADGLDDQHISQHYGISVRTVRAHITNIFHKLDVQSRTQAVLVAVRHNAVRLGDER